MSAATYALSARPGGCREDCLGSLPVAPRNEIPRAARRRERDAGGPRPCRPALGFAHGSHAQT